VRRKGWWRLAVKNEAGVHLAAQSARPRRPTIWWKTFCPWCLTAKWYSVSPSRYVIGYTLDCVLIDDDVTVQTVWESSARTFGKRIRVFSDPPTDNDLETVPRDTLFYIDQKLRNGERGTEVSKRHSAAR